MLPDEDDPMEKITDLLAWGNDVEIIELDKSGHPQQQWLHAHDGHILPVSSSISVSLSFFSPLLDVSDIHVLHILNYWPRFNSGKRPTACSLALFENGARQPWTRSSPSDSRIPSQRTISHTRCLILSRPSFPPSARSLPTALCFRVSESAMPRLPPRLRFCSPL